MLFPKMGKCMTRLSDRNSNSYYASVLKNSHRLPKEHVNALVLLSKKGNRLAQEKLINSHMRFIVAVARVYTKMVPTASFDDLVQEGSRGLLHAISVFDTTRGINFASYGVFWIKQNIICYLVNDKLIHIPKNVQDDLRRAQASCNGEVTRDFLEDKLGYHKERAERVMHVVGMNRIDLDAPQQSSKDKSSFSVHDIIASDDDEVVVEPWIAEHILSWADVVLDSDERFVLECMFPLNGNAVMTNKDTAQALGKSPDRVRDIKNKALRKLREVVEC